MDDPRLPRRVRCYACGRRQDPRADACERCATVFVGLCTCGVPHSLYSTSCVSCGRRLVAKRLPRSRHPAVRAARWGLALVGAGAVAAVFLTRDDADPPWKLKAVGETAFREERYEDAARAFEAATRGAPRDFQAWFDLALSYERLRMAPETYIPPARRAAELSPRTPELRIFLAEAYRRAGRPLEALEEARTAVEIPEAPPDASVLLARLLLASTQPDVDGAIDALRGALRRSPSMIDARILLAETYLLVYGTLPASAYPPEVAAAMAQAKDSIAELVPAGSTKATSAAASSAIARIFLACGRPEDAFIEASGALEDTGAEPSDEIRAELLVTRGRALLEWREFRDGARKDFIAALDRLPDPATCQAILRPLTAQGRGELVEEVFSAASEARDPAGAVATALAQVRLSLGRLDAALAAAETARSRAPNDPSAALVHGDVLAARGDAPGAAAAYREAQRLAPGLTTAKVQESLLALTAPESSRPEALETALAALRPLLQAAPRDAAIHAAVARLEIAAGRPDAAVEAARRATELAPGNAVAWQILAGARLAQRSPEAAGLAAAALGRARTLRPGDPALAFDEVAALLGAGDAAGAVSAATRHLASRPDDRDLLAARARAAVMLEQWEAAAADLLRLRNLGNSSPDLIAMQAECAFRTGNHDAAVRFVDEAIAGASALHRESLELLRMQYERKDTAQIVEALRQRGATPLLARVQLMTGDAAAAAATAAALLERTPGDAAATETYVLGTMDARGGEPAARADCLERIAALPEESAPWLRAVLRARVLLAEGRFADADRELLAFGESLPRTALVSFLRGIAAYEAGRRADGLVLLRESPRLPGATPALVARIADRIVAAAQREPNAAVREGLLREALRSDPQSPDAASALAYVLFLRGEPRQGAAVAEQGLHSTRATVAQVTDLRMRAAACHAAAGNADVALDHLAAVARSGADAPHADLVRGHALSTQGRYEESDAALVEAERRDPGTPWPALGRLRNCVLRRDLPAARELVARRRSEHPGDLLFSLAGARMFAASGHADEAAAMLRDAAATQPDSEPIARMLVDTLSAAGRRAEAIEAARAFAARTASATAPGPARALLASILLAEAGGAREGLELSEALLQDAAADAPSRREAGVLRSRALLLVGRAAEARSAAEALLSDRESPLSPDLEWAARDVAGLAATVAGDWPVAIRHLRRCAELRPSDARTLNNAAWAMAQHKDTVREALDLARRAAAAAPANADCWATLGFAADAADALEEAQTAFEQCLQRHVVAPAADPVGRGRAAIRLAGVLRRRGQLDAAVRVLRGVAAFEPAPPAEIRDEVAKLLAP